MMTPLFVLLEIGAAVAFGACALIAARRYGPLEQTSLHIPAWTCTAGIGAGAAALTLRHSSLHTAGFAIVFAAAAVCAASDLATGLVFDAVTFPALALLLLCAAMNGDLEWSIAGSLCAAGSIACVYALSRGRGIGLGDAKLAACIGAALGARASFYALGIAFVAGAFAGLIALAARRMRRGAEIRFAPYLAAGTVAAVVWGLA